MIPKAIIAAVAGARGWLDTTVDKDYVLGWLLFGIATREETAPWVLEGGAGLEKCFFDTYRCSEYLAFGIPADRELTEVGVLAALSKVCAWVEGEAGIGFSAPEIVQRGTESYRAKLTYRGVIDRPRNSLQRVWLDMHRRRRSDASVALRGVFHPYPDAPRRAPAVRCCAVDEILADKALALYECRGRAGDVYDVVHLSRCFREEVSPEFARAILVREFAARKLGAPTVEVISARVDWEIVRRDWQQQLRHQLPKLPDVKSFAADLHDALAWWIEPSKAAPLLRPAPGAATHEQIARSPFPTPTALGVGPRPRGELPESIRFAARNRMLAQFDYQGFVRVVEPYSLRIRENGRVLLYAFERSNDEAWTGFLKAYLVDDIVGAEALEVRFRAQWAVEL